jgi:hypothetical protein
VADRIGEFARHASSNLERAERILENFRRMFVFKRMIFEDRKNPDRSGSGGWQTGTDDLTDRRMDGANRVCPPRFQEKTR